MPGMNGKALADRLTLKDPNLRVLFISGYPADHLDTQSAKGRGAEFLPKPFGPTALLQRVREVLDAGRVVG